MAAAKFTKNSYRALATYFKNSNKSLALNNYSMKIGRKNHNVSAFLGLNQNNDLVLTGGICFGSGPTLWSLIFKIDLRNKGYHFSFPEIPVGMTHSQAKKIILQLCRDKKDFIHDRMVNITMGIKNKGGQRNGARLEAHPKHRTLPRNTFAANTNKFTPDFALNAVNLHITYL